MDLPGPFDGVAQMRPARQRCRMQRRGVARRHPPGLGVYGRGVVADLGRGEAHSYGDARENRMAGAGPAGSNEQRYYDVVGGMAGAAQQVAGNTMDGRRRAGQLSSDSRGVGEMGQRDRREPVIARTAAVVSANCLDPLGPAAACRREPGPLDQCGTRTPLAVPSVDLLDHHHRHLPWPFLAAPVLSDQTPSPGALAPTCISVLHIVGP